MGIDKELKYLVTTGLACLLAGFALGKDTQRGRGKDSSPEKDSSPREDNDTYCGSACFDDRTEVMTSGGFSFWKDIDLDSEIAQYDMETGEISFSKPSSLIERLHVGKMLSFRSETVDICVTPDHDLIGMRKLNDSKAVPKYEKIKAADITERMPFPTSAKNEDTWAFFNELKEMAYQSERPKENIFDYEASGLPQSTRALGGFDLTKIDAKTAHRIVRRLCRDYGVQAGGTVYGIIAVTLRDATLSDKFIVLCTIAGEKAYKAPGSQTVLVYIGSCVMFQQVGYYPSPELVSYSGYVYCATMPKGTIVTRRNGRIAIAGNKSFG